jgi:hypothetical protein
MTVIVACGGTLWGGQNTYIAVQNRTPLALLARRRRRWWHGGRSPLPRATLARDRAADAPAGPS